MAVLLSACPIHRGDPMLLCVVDTGIRHEQVLGLLDPHGFVIDQHLDRLSGEAPIDIQTEVMDPNVAVLTHLAGQLAEAEDAPEPGRFDGMAAGVTRMTSGDR